jgi:hypothetical protein
MYSKIFGISFVIIDAGIIPALICREMQYFIRSHKRRQTFEKKRKTIFKAGKSLPFILEIQ